MHGQSVVTQVWVSNAGVQVWVELVRKPGTVMGIISTRPERVTDRDEAGSTGQRSSSPAGDKHSCRRTFESSFGVKAARREQI